MLSNRKQEKSKKIDIEHDSPGKTLHRGSVVWAKLSKNYQFWPGILLEHEDCGMDHAGPLHRWIYWFGDHRISKVENDNIFDFDEHFDRLFKERGSQNYNSGIGEAKAVLEKRFNFKGFIDISSEENRDISSCTLDIPQDIIKDLAAIKLQNLISKKMIKQEEDTDMNNVPEIECIGGSYSSDMEIEFCYPDPVPESSESETKLSVNNKVSLKVGKFTLNKVCICCQVLCTGLRDRYSHPIFVGLCCRECYIKVKECMFVIGEDDVHIYCSICATPGETFICDNRKCNRVFCYQCIEQYWNRKKVSKIHRQSPWLCFLCTGDNTSDFLKIEGKWEENVMNLFKTSTHPVIEYDLNVKPKLHVLSLCDGISAVLVALEELGLDLASYIALEDNPKAVHVSLVHHGTKPYYANFGSIKHFHFNSLKDKNLPIDLLISGFYKDLCIKKPMVNQDKERDVYDAKSCTHFLEFYRMWKLVQKNQEGYPFFWLFVNDGIIPSSTRELITRFLECDPIVLNTRKYTSHCHYRLAWGNIPGMASNWIKADSNVAPALTAEGNLVRNKKKDKEWVSKMEQLFGFGEHYTNIGNVNILERQTLLGSSGNVHLIKKMLQPLLHLFALKENKTHGCRNI